MLAWWGGQEGTAAMPAASCRLQEQLTGGERGTPSLEAKVQNG